MKHLKRAFFAMAFMALGISAHAQYVITHAKMAMPGQQKGIYYALPRTVIKLDLIIDETELIEGPCSDYAYMVGANDYITSDGMEYHLRDIRMSTYAEADPSATFFVSMSPRKDDAATFYLTSKGILQGVGIMGGELIEPTVVEEACKASNQDRIFKFQYGNGMRGRDQLARSAAEMINRIREEKIKLLTGFQETAFTLDTYRQMYADLDAMEQEYLSLFVGKRIVNTVVQTVYVTLTKDVPSQTVGSFSEEKGFSSYDLGLGNTLTVQAISLQTTGSINPPSQSAVETLSHDNKLFYRIPETAYVKVSLGDDVLIERRETLAQFGVFMLAPLGRTKLGLDPNTGQIISMGME